MNNIQRINSIIEFHESFFHLFNFLHDSNKQLVFSSDQHPNVIQNLEDRLKSRFAAGMVIAVTPPDHQSRLAIVRTKAALHNVLLPDEVKEPDRTWLALAAYNLGMGHLNAARAIAIRQKRDPNSWYEMKQVLPLLARPEYYDNLKSGMGRGGEAVILVENIRTYYDILSHFEPAWQPGLQAPLSLSKPPIQGRNAKGTVKLPSAL